MGSLHTEEGLPYAVPDHSRAQRQGAGEVVYGESKRASCARCARAASPW